MSLQYRVSDGTSPGRQPDASSRCQHSAEARSPRVARPLRGGRARRQHDWRMRRPVPTSTDLARPATFAFVPRTSTRRRSTATSRIARSSTRVGAASRTRTCRWSTSPMRRRHRCRRRDRWDVPLPAAPTVRHPCSSVHVRNAVGDTDVNGADIDNIAITATVGPVAAGGWPTPVPQTSTRARPISTLQPPPPPAAPRRTPRRQRHPAAGHHRSTPAPARSPARPTPPPAALQRRHLPSTDDGAAARDGHRVLQVHDRRCARGRHPDRGHPGQHRRLADGRRHRDHRGRGHRRPTRSAASTASTSRPPAPTRPRASPTPSSCSRRRSTTARSRSATRSR